MKRMLMAWVCATALFYGCGDDEKVDGHTGGTGGKATGGTGGGGKGGADGSVGGTSGTGAVAGGGTGGVAGTAGDAAKSARLLVAGTDFATKTEVATIDVTSGAISGSVTFADGDAVPAASGEAGFVLERTLGKIDLLTPAGQIAKTIDVGKSALGETGSGSSNPVNVALVNGKAYVVLGAANKLAVVDLTAGSISKAIDLASYQAAGDADGAVDAVGAIPTASPGRVYFVLGRIDRTTITAPSYELACPTAKALVMAVDTTTDTIADLNGSAAGEGLELTFANPVDVAFDAGQNELRVLSAGCFQPGDAGSTRVSAGINVIDISTGAVTTVYVSPNQDYLARLLPLSGTLSLIDAFDPTFAEHWYPLTAGQPSFGAELTGVPAAPSVESSAALLGIQIGTTDAGASVDVVRYTVANQQSTTIASNPWTSDVTNAAGTALVE